MTGDPVGDATVARVLRSQLGDCLAFVERLLSRSNLQQYTQLNLAVDCTPRHF